MRRKPRTTRIIAAFFLWACLCLVGITRAGDLEEYPATGPTPPLMLPDLGGKTHSLSDYPGRVVLVNFWASWCAPCVVEMPSIQRLKASLAGRDFTVLAVNYRESRSTAWRFRNLLKIDFPVLMDTDGKAAADWQVAVYPTSYLLDTSGRIRYVAYGQLQWDAPDVVQLIEHLLNQPGTNVTPRRDSLPATGMATAADLR